MNLKMACPDRPTGKLIRNSLMIEPTWDMVVIKRHNGEIRMKTEAYMKLSKSQRNRLHKAWEEN